MSAPAPEPAPTAEHIDAVMGVFASDREECGRAKWTNEYVGRRVARAILTSTDPAVHLAMLDALVRAGVLTPEDAPIYRGAEHHHWQQRWDGEHTHEGGRYVTPWEVAP